jgi:hypothetical protein
MLAAPISHWLVATCQESVASTLCQWAAGASVCLLITTRQDLVVEGLKVSWHQK